MKDQDNFNKEAEEDDEADYSFLYDEDEEDPNSLQVYLAEEIENGVLLVASNLQTLRNSKNFENDKLEFRNELENWFKIVLEKIMDHVEEAARENLPATHKKENPGVIFAYRIATCRELIYGNLPNELLDLNYILESIGRYYQDQLNAIYNSGIDKTIVNNKLQDSRLRLIGLNTEINEFFWQAWRSVHWDRKLVEYNKDTKEYIGWSEYFEDVVKTLYAKLEENTQYFNDHIDTYIKNIFKTLNYLRIKTIEIKRLELRDESFFDTHQQLLSLVQKQLQEMQMDFICYIKMVYLTGDKHLIHGLQQWLQENIQKQLAKNLCKEENLPRYILELSSLYLNSLSAEELEVITICTVMKLALFEFKEQLVTIEDINKAIEEQYATKSNEDLCLELENKSQKYSAYLDYLLANTQHTTPDEIVNLGAEADKLAILHSYAKIDRDLLGTEATQDWQNWRSFNCFADSEFTEEEIEAALTVLNIFLEKTDYYVSAFMNSYNGAFDTIEDYEGFVNLLHDSQARMPIIIATYTSYINEDSLDWDWSDHLRYLCNNAIECVGLMFKEMFKPFQVEEQEMH